MTTQGKLNYEAQLKNLAISHSMLETATIEGELKGELKGELRTRKSTAQKLILRGFANEDIADIAGLSVDLIEQIRKEMN
jgi:hypothetical protein